MVDKKDGVRRALLNYSKKELKKWAPKRPRLKRNKHPERDLVQVPCVAWMRQIGWIVKIYESKATWNPSQQRYMQQAMAAGHADCMGNTLDGLTVAVEFKAPGKLKTFTKDGNQRQIEFIIEKIDSNCFACVVDSLEMLKRIWIEYCLAKSQSLETARAYLLSQLP